MFHGNLGVYWVLGLLVLACTNAQETPKAGQKAPLTRNAPVGSGATNPATEPTQNVAGSDGPPGVGCEEAAPESLPSGQGIGGPRLTAPTGAQLPPGWIAYASGGMIWRASTRGDKRQRLGAGVSPKWLPNGESLLYISAAPGQPARLISAPKDCGAGLALTGPLLRQDDADAVLAEEQAPLIYAPSPDSQRVAFTRRGGQSSSLFVLELATGQERRLAEDVGFVEPAWQPDGRAVFYVAPGGERDVVMRADVMTGESMELVTAYRPLLAVTPQLGLIFQSAVGSSLTIEDRQVQLMGRSVDGRLTVLQGSHLGPGLYDELGASPDGQKLAASWGLWTGNGPGALRDYGLSIFSLSRRPLAQTTSRRSAFAGKEDAIRFSRPTTPSASSGFSSERYRASHPSWAPDSRHIAYTLADCDQERSDCRPLIVAVDTAAFPKGPVELVFLANGSHPAWMPEAAPDGPQPGAASSVE